MRMRKVRVTLDLMTDEPIDRLRDVEIWDHGPNRQGPCVEEIFSGAALKVCAVQATVIRGMSKRQMLQAMKPQETT